MYFFVNHLSHVDSIRGQSFVRLIGDAKKMQMHVLHATKLEMIHSIDKTSKLSK